MSVRSTKVWVFLLALSASLLLAGYELADRFGLFAALALSLFFISLSFFFGDSEILKTLKAKALLGQDPWQLRLMAENFAKKLAMPAPKVYLIDSPAATAFALDFLGRGSICLTTGILTTLNPQELEAVVARQIVHLHRLNRLSVAICHTLANMLVGFARWLDRLTAKLGLPKHSFTQLIAPLAWTILRVALNDKMFLESDELAGSLIADRKNLARALWKLEALNQAYPLDIPPCTSHFFLVNPSDRLKRNWLLLTHPKIDIRLKRLIGYFPL